MCGISGIVGRAELRAEERAGVASANASLAHRGPDGEGRFDAPHVRLMMRRLSIIDLEGGWQPLYNEDRSLALVFNGEIYNFVELRRGLEARGHRFNTGSDGETILHLYEEHGLGCVEHLRGMFAFALWDEARRRLVLARDRMGEKPLYLYEGDGRLAFASEMKALLDSGLVPFELDPESVDLYFHHQYVPEPRTPLRGVRKLDAAHVLTVDVDDWRLSESCYWRIEDAPETDGDPVELIRAELDTVTTITLRSDVPVGLALSGGLDSSALAALCAPKYRDTFHCFSVGYRGQAASDERQDAKSLASRLGLQFHDVEVAAEDVAEFFPRLVEWTDDPVADISAYGYYAVNRLAAESGIRVMLSGQGGDELFWGYAWVAEAARQSLEKAALFGHGNGGRLDLRAWARQAFAEANGLPERYARSSYITGRRHALDWRRRPLLRLARYLRSDRARLVFMELSPEFGDIEREARALLTDGWRSSFTPENAYAPSTLPMSEWGDVPVKLSALIARTYLRSNGVVQGDRLSMASSVEQRLPLLDHRLWEVVQGARKRNSDFALPPKAWFVRALEGVLPRDVIERPKRGFTPPVGEWKRLIFERHGRDLAEGLLVGEGVCRPEAIARLLARPRESSSMLYRCLVLEQWARAMKARREAARAAAGRVRGAA
ncbi:MAG TPA: asparagine synthase (glutamine-hydrolyzing) [Pyrinomonadaceae bacterium]|nr:asparagine synthase (glutamine-hydrolyzing) [Pyrinomonadaceae bacterium]